MHSFRIPVVVTLLSACVLSVSQAAPSIDTTLQPELPGVLVLPWGDMKAFNTVDPDGTVSDHLNISLFDPEGTLVDEVNVPGALDYTYAWRPGDGVLRGFYTYRIEYYSTDNPTEPATSEERIFLAASDGLCAFVFIDDNGDGIYNVDTDYLAGGWEICISGPIDDCRVTEAPGAACFFDIPAGLYTVCETLQDGYANTTPLCREIVVEEYEVGKAIFGNEVLVVPIEDSSWGRIKSNYRD